MPMTPFFESLPSKKEHLHRGLLTFSEKVFELSR